MKIRAGSVSIQCATCDAELYRQHVGFQFDDVDDVEKVVRMTSKWATPEDPDGLTCNVCQRDSLLERTKQAARIAT